ncbi:MAG: peptidyl-prolyl cis-trans isomerase [Bacteroidales bacterium]|nr:peptidyl-prolyl cis-trans isomerase [Bacteroidales bacterium]
MKRFCLLIAICAFAIACTKKAEKKADTPIANVFDRYLYMSDLKGIVPPGLAAADSTILVKDYIDKWIRKQLLLVKAEENLTVEEKNVTKQIEEYRSSLLVFKYEQNFIQQKLDTNVSFDEIETYYNQNSPNFVLNTNLVKATLIKVPKTAPDISNIRKWYKSVKEDDIKQVEIYCYKYADIYDYFNEDWVEFSYILNQLPPISTSPQNILKYQNSLEVDDSTSLYFVRLYDYKLEGTLAPLEYVSSNIKSIIVNKRKIQMINQLEADIYNEALNLGSFKTY